MKKTQKITPVDDQKDHTIKDLKIQQIIPNMIDNYIVSVIDDHHTLVMPPLETGMQFKLWLNSKGGVFSKDVLNYTLNKPHGKYIRIKGDNINCVARLISDEELETFKTLKLVDGQIKDKYYMILKNINNGEKLTSVNKYIFEKEITHYEENVVSLTPHAGLHEDEIDYHAGSISLFSE